MPVPCVVYAAKSSEDRRGSIPDQLEECREQIERDADRVVADEYVDERRSAFTGNRGPGLVDAMQHAEELVLEHGQAELWVQHSDRLARGDGIRARHTVEIGLWALKRGVTVRCVQDPDTFRDLLYAVVTGQRNHEDSRRRGLAMAAGRRRAAERGEFIGYLPDGYKLAAEIDVRGHVTKRMVIDPDRRPVIEMIFRFALRGRTSGQIAVSLNRRGWVTKPHRKDAVAAKWTSSSVLHVLKNPRYAGLAPFAGRIVARDSCPGYITERQHQRIVGMLDARKPAKGTKPLRLETYLLAGLMVCGRCGRRIHCQTTTRRVDGAASRRYVCASHEKDRHADRCGAPMIAADQLEAMLVASLRTLLTPNPQAARDGEPEPGVDLAWERQRLRDAADQDEQSFQRALEGVLARRREMELSIEQGPSQRLQRQLKEVGRFEAWAAEELAGRSEHSRAEASELSGLLRRWFTEITVDVAPLEVTICVVRRFPLDASKSEREAAVRFDRLDWTRVACLVGRRRFRCAAWDDVEILGAMQAWAQLHDRAPTSKDWVNGHGVWPTNKTVYRHFPSWRTALRRAGLTTPRPSGPPRNWAWSDEEILDAVRAWIRQHGRAPRWDEWARAEPGRPCTWTVEQHFGGWKAGVAAAINGS
jgi:DNA invertase Pin-like site-specific DNA recombinase